jgi:hypothetical protein
VRRPTARGEKRQSKATRRGRRRVRRHTITAHHPRHPCAAITLNVAIPPPAPAPVAIGSPPASWTTPPPSPGPSPKRPRGATPTTNVARPRLWTATTTRSSGFKPKPWPHDCRAHHHRLRPRPGVRLEGCLVMSTEKAIPPPKPGSVPTPERSWAAAPPASRLPSASSRLRPRARSTRERRHLRNLHEQHEGQPELSAALKQGWPIATGVIGRACRHLVKDRMDARLRLRTGPASRCVRTSPRGTEWCWPLRVPVYGPCGRGSW